MTKTKIAALAASLLAASFAGPAAAGSPYTQQPPDRGRVPDPAASGVPNVPDLQGCVKWCQRDMNPCDPPLFKRADGRCSNLD